MPQIICNNLTLAYDGRTVAAELNFEVNKGDYLCIVGENGSGKSTLVKVLLGLKKQAAGEIVFEKGLAAQNFGYLPQQNAAQKDFPASVWEVVLSGAAPAGTLRPFYSAAEKEMAAQSLEKLGMAKWRKTSFQNLSGGQQQRVLLARAVCSPKQVLVLDEPTAGLDPAITAELYRQVAAIHEDGVSVIMVSHDIETAIEAATHILHIAGKGNFFGTVAQYKESGAYRRLLGEGGL